MPQGYKEFAQLLVSHCTCMPQYIKEHVNDISATLPTNTNRAPRECQEQLVVE